MRAHFTNMVRELEVRRERIRVQQKERQCKKEKRNGGKDIETTRDQSKRERNVGATKKQKTTHFSAQNMTSRPKTWKKNRERVQSEKGQKRLTREANHLPP